MQDIVANVIEGLGTAQALAGGVIAWLTTRFEWWKNSNSKLVKVGVPLALFIGVALALSALD